MSTVMIQLLEGFDGPFRDYEEAQLWADSHDLADYSFRLINAPVADPASLAREFGLPEDDWFLDDLSWYEDWYDDLDDWDDEPYEAA